MRAVYDLANEVWSETGDPCFSPNLVAVHEHADYLFSCEEKIYVNMRRIINTIKLEKKKSM